MTQTDRVKKEPQKMNTASALNGHTHTHTHTKPVKCPIPGCNLSFSRGILGWHSHVERTDAHPYWHPTVTQPGARKELFAKEFPEFFELAIGHKPPSSPPPPMPEEKPRTKSGTFAAASTRADITAEGVTKLVTRVLALCIELEALTAELRAK